MLKKLFLSLSFIAGFIPCFIYAEALPRGLSIDPRVKIVNYQPDNITRVAMHYGYSTDILFDINETVENVVMGDSLAWQATPVKNHLFIKPLALSTTNMTVLTNLRHYNFQLVTSQNNRDAVYELKFMYPDEEASPVPVSVPALCNPTRCNWRYAFTGDKTLAPVQAFDDGRFTYFKFSGNLPAVYAVDKRRNERLINYRMQDGYMVIHQIGKQFTLRKGDAQTCVYNDAGMA